MAYSGLGSQAGGKKETTWGTAVTPDQFWEYESESFALDQSYYDGLGLRAGRTFAPGSRTKKTNRAAGGDLVLAVPYKGFGFFLDQMVSGTITPAQQASTIAYLSTFNVGASVSPKSATLQINKPTTQGVDTPYTYPGSVLHTAAFSIDVGGVLMGTTSWTSKDETTPSTTPAGAGLATATYIAGNDVWAHPEITLTLNGTAAAAIRSVTWTWDQPMTGNERTFLGGSGVIAQPRPNGLATVTGTFAGEWYDSTYYDLFRSGAFAALVITAQGPTAIASTYFPTFRSTFSAIQIRGTSPQVAGADLLDLSVPFVAKDDGTNPPWKAEIISTDSTAW